MTKKYFNFNHETELTPFELHDDGTVEFTLNNESATFDSVQAFAEFYAQARSVLPENLKNWQLIEDAEQNTFAFVLRAGTAGSDEDLKSFIQTLKDLDYTPEQIGEAVKAYNKKSDTTEPAVDIDALIDDVVDKETGWVGEYLYFNKHLVKEQLTLNDERYADYVENYDSLLFDDEPSYEEYVRYEINNAIQIVIEEKGDSLKEQLYPISYLESDIPVEILYDIDERDFSNWELKTDKYASGENAEKVLREKIIASKLAKRDLNIEFNVILNEDYPSTRDSFYIEEDEKTFKRAESRDFETELSDYIADVQTNFATSQDESDARLYFMRNKFYILLDVNEIA